jgi:hypothetical protein
MLSNEDTKMLLTTLSKMGMMLTLDGIEEKNIRSIAIGNAIGVALAISQLGPEACVDLLKAIEPLSLKIAKEKESGNPALSGMHVVSGQGEILRNEINEEGDLKTDLNLKDLLKDIGITTN